MTRPSLRALVRPSRPTWLPAADEATLVMLPDSFETWVVENPAWTVASWARLAPLSWSRACWTALLRSSGATGAMPVTVSRMLPRRPVTVSSRLLVVSAAFSPSRPPRFVRPTLSVATPALLRLTGRLLSMREDELPQLATSSTMPIERLDAQFCVSVTCAVASAGAEEVIDVSERQGRSAGSGSLTLDDSRLQLPMAAPCALGSELNSVDVSPIVMPLSRSLTTGRPPLPAAPPTTGSEPTPLLTAGSAPSRGEFSRGMDRSSARAEPSPLNRAFDSAAVAVGMKALRTNKQDNISTALRFTELPPF